MSGAGRAIDADNHYYEVDDCFSRHIESRYADRALRPVPGKEPARKWMLGDRLVSFMPFNAYDQTAAPGALEKFFTGEEGKQCARPGGLHPPPRARRPMVERSARLRLLDEQGLDAIIQLPTVGMLVEPDFADQPDVLMANYRAFNRWVEEDWGYGTGKPDRGRRADLRRSDRVDGRHRRRRGRGRARRRARRPVRAPAHRPGGRRAVPG